MEQCRADDIEKSAERQIRPNDPGARVGHRETLQRMLTKSHQKVPMSAPPTKLLSFRLNKRAKRGACRCKCCEIFGNRKQEKFVERVSGFVCVASTDMARGYGTVITNFFISLRGTRND